MSHLRESRRLRLVRLVYHFIAISVVMWAGVALINSKSFLHVARRDAQPFRVAKPAAEEIAGPNNTGKATTATGIPHKSRDTLAENFFFMCAGYA